MARLPLAAAAPLLAAIWAGGPARAVRAVRVRSGAAPAAGLGTEGAMPAPIAAAMKLRMPEGADISVGFEFECANKLFMLTHYLQQTADMCPEVEFPLNGRSAPKPREMMSEIFEMPGPGETDRFDMANFSAMPPSVRNIVWTKDALSPDHGDECMLDEEGWFGPRKIPGRGLVEDAGDWVYNNGECECWYSLEFKTLPLHSASDLREAMIGAALTLKEASKREDHFKGWNVEDLFRMTEGREKCTGSTHVTKAFVINHRSILEILKQQMYGFCAKGWSKESAGDKVFRTSFAEAYMLWRAMHHCQGESMEDCRTALRLQDMCESAWADRAAAQADVEEHLLSDSRDWEAAMGPTLHRFGLDSDSTVGERAEMPCSPGRMLSMACKADDGVDEAMLQNADAALGFGEPGMWPYYGPGGPDGRDTSTKIGAMLSSDGETLFGLAEHRKDAWNSMDFRMCLYASLGRAKDARHAGELFDKSPYCKRALGGATTVDFAGS